jgi:hypothetical protein
MRGEQGKTLHREGKMIVVAIGNGVEIKEVAEILDEILVDLLVADLKAIVESWLREMQKESQRQAAKLN